MPPGDLSARLTVAFDAMRVALAALDPLGKRVTTDPGDALNVLPAIVLGPPNVVLDGYGTATEMTFVVCLIVARDAAAVVTLLGHLPSVMEALDETEASVIRADPGVYAPDSHNLPCYEITVEYPM